MDYSQNNKFKNILAFCILMGNEKILTKSPEYIMEKYQRYLGIGPVDSWQWGLDGDNSKLFASYHQTWFKKADDGNQSG